MKIFTKVSALMLAGCLTSVFASSTQIQTNAKIQVSQQIQAQIAKIKASSPQERVKLVNEFKMKLQTLTPVAKEAAVNMYSKMQNGMTHAQTKVQNGTTNAQTKVQNGMQNSQTMQQNHNMQQQGMDSGMGANMNSHSGASGFMKH